MGYSNVKVSVHNYYYYFYHHHYYQRANFPESFESDTLKEIILTAYPNANIDMEVIDIEDTDWVTQVQSSWKPQIIDDLTIRFPWHDPSETQTKMELVLEGGAAFGTGDHPTTRLCCKWLARNIESNKKNIEVLDYGCGSAILGLAALKYGASKADGTDIDLDALISASRNCINNNLSMDLYLADDSELDEVQSIVMNQLRGSNSNVNFLPVSKIQDKKYDLVVANILAPILISLAPQLAKHTKQNGKIALSGLVIQQKDVLINRYAEFFDDVILEESEDDWILITGIIIHFIFCVIDIIIIMNYRKSKRLKLRLDIIY